MINSDGTLIMAKQDINKINKQESETAAMPRSNNSPAIGKINIEINPEAELYE